MKPEEGKVIKLNLRTRTTVFGKIQGAEYFQFKPVRSQPCNCITSHEVIPLDSDEIDSWEYPENQKELNTIYEEYLTDDK